MNLRSAWLLALCAALAAWAEPALARDRADRAERDADRDAEIARKHFQKGEKLFALSKFEEALDEYEAAFDAQPLPEFLFNIGQCHRNLKNYDAAIFSFKKYLRLKPDASNHRAVEKLIHQLEAQLEAKVAQQEEAEAANRPPPDDEQRVPLVPPPDDRPPPRKDATPFYSTWWFWTSVAVVGAGAGAAVLLWPSDSGVPGSDLGNIDFPR
jgi:tetratricopeptide (TPR) repeat protein